MAATKKKARAPRRKKAEAGSKGLSPKDMLSGTESLEALEKHIVDDGGAVIGRYRDPLGGHGVVIAALPIDKVEPTTYQRVCSETLVRPPSTDM